MLYGNVKVGLAVHGLHGLQASSLFALYNRPQPTLQKLRTNIGLMSRLSEKKRGVCPAGLNHVLGHARGAPAGMLFASQQSHDLFHLGQHGLAVAGRPI